jgi:hypothetical protein
MEVYKAILKEVEEKCRVAKAARLEEQRRMAEQETLARPRTPPPERFTEPSVTEEFSTPSPPALIHSDSPSPPSGRFPGPRTPETLTCQRGDIKSAVALDFKAPGSDFDSKPKLQTSQYTQLPKDTGQPLQISEASLSKSGGGECPLAPKIKPVTPYTPPRYPSARYSGPRKAKKPSRKEDDKFTASAEYVEHYVKFNPNVPLHRPHQSPVPRSFQFGTLPPVDLPKARQEEASFGPIGQGRPTKPQVISPVPTRQKPTPPQSSVSKTYDEEVDDIDSQVQAVFAKLGKQPTTSQLTTTQPARPKAPTSWRTASRAATTPPEAPRPPRLQSLFSQEDHDEFEAMTAELEGRSTTPLATTPKPTTPWPVRPPPIEPQPPREKQDNDENGGNGDDA